MTRAQHDIVELLECELCAQLLCALAQLDYFQLADHVEQA
jgi:hypothetical protein